METKYCPSCGQDVELEASLEGSYVLHACRICGLGLGIKVATTQEVARFKSQGLPKAPPPPAAAGQSGAEPFEATDTDETPATRQAATGPLAKVGTVKKEVPLQPVVERPTPPDPRSETPHHPLPAAGSMESAAASASMSIDTTNTQMPAIRPTASGSMPALGGPVRQMRRVFVVEDSTFLREVTRDLLTQRHLAREVVDCPDGSAFLEAFTRACDEDRKPDLVVLDVRMPGMDGREAAFTVRAIEAGFQISKKTPILFFSGVLCDDRFKRLLQKIGNAKYIRKTDGGDVQELGERIVAVLERLVGSKKSA
jgi:CheY-like chemotaxis protein